MHLVCHTSYYADYLQRIIVRLGHIMCDLTKRGIIAAPPLYPKGIAFEIADLIRIVGWAEFYNFRMMVRLDHGTDGEDYEEVITFHPGIGSPCHLIMWRNAKSVFVQPLVGRRQRYGSVSAALGSLAAKPGTKLTDNNAPTWPTG